jgi:hypothetical protein
LKVPSHGEAVVKETAHYVDYDVPEEDPSRFDLAQECTIDDYSYN